MSLHRRSDRPSQQSLSNVGPHCTLNLARDRFIAGACQGRLYSRRTVNDSAFYYTLEDAKKKRPKN